MSTPTPFAAELPWIDFQASVKGGKTPILIPLGSMEQHGHHMPLHVDVLLPIEFSRRAAIAVGGLVAPPFAYGYKSHQKSGGGNHMPGTVSLEGATLVSALRDVIKEFARHGGRRFAIMNGHYENAWFITEAVDLALRELRWDGIMDAKVVVLSYWDFVTPEIIERLYPDGFTGWAVEHGGVLETSLMLVLHPQLVQLDRAIDHAPATFPPYDVYPVKPEWTPASGTLSSPRHASHEKGEILLEVCSKGIVDALNAEFGPSTP
jgi:creatinine amidohydrolase